MKLSAKEEQKMCRLASMVSIGNKSYLILDYLLDAFQEAAYNDPFIPKGPKVNVHRDGWGAILHGKFKNDFYSTFIKSYRPAFNDPTYKIFKEDYKDANELFLIVHARKASPGTAYGVSFLHPFEKILSDSRVFYLAHNGTIHRREILRNEWKINNLTLSDTQLLVQRIADVATQTGQQIFDAVHDTVIELGKREDIPVSAIQLLVMELEKENTRLQALSLIKNSNAKTEEQRKINVRYYKLYAIRLSLDNTAAFSVMSSTVLLKLKEKYSDVIEIDYEIELPEWSEIREINEDFVDMNKTDVLKHLVKLKL